MEAMYQHPNPSTLAEWRAGVLLPVGHWHVIYDRSGRQRFSAWVPNALEEPRELYLKGRGKGKGKGPDDKGKGKGQGKGKVLGEKGKGEARARSWSI